ncbi:MAG: hypothetical protein RR840_05725 [Clostridium sp.]
MGIRIDTNSNLFSSTVTPNNKDIQKQTQQIKEIEYDPKKMNSYDHALIRNQVSLGVIDLKTEEFIKGIEESGLSKDINWGSLKLDLVNINPGGLEGNNFNSNIDFLSSKYATLKNQINKDFQGDDLKGQLDKLDSIFKEATDRLSSSIADQVGAFFDGNGSTGDREKIFNSVNAIYNSQVEAYTKYIGENPSYANILDAKDKWLERDSYYMSGKLRESCNIDKVSSSKEAYSKYEVSVMATFVDSLKKAMPSSSTFAPSEESIGLQMGIASIKTSVLLESANLNSNITDKIKSAQTNYFNKILDAYDSRYEEAKSSPGSLSEYSKVNREAVNNVYSFIVNKYNSNKNPMATILEGIDFATEVYNSKRQDTNFSHLGKYKYHEEFFRDMNRVGEDRFSKPLGTKESIIKDWNKFISEPNIKNKDNYTIKDNNFNKLI